MHKTTKRARQLRKGSGLLGPVLLLACSGELGGDGSMGSMENSGATGNATGAPTGSGEPGNGEPGTSGGGAGSNSSSGSTTTNGGGSNGPPPDVPEGIALEGCDSEGALPDHPMLKLSTLQYRNTVRDLLTSAGAASVADGVLDLLDAIPEDSRSAIFRGLDDRVSSQHVEGYLDVAFAAADAIAADAELLAAVAGDCATEETLSDECAASFLDEFVRRAYRRPLTDDEIEEYSSLRDATSSGAEAIRAMIAVSMSSPRFVNHVEIDGVALDDEGLMQISAYEIASRLSYTFWQTMPDDELFQAAEDGTLGTSDGLTEQLDRLFDDPRARQTLGSFWTEWLGLENFTGFETTRPGFQTLAGGLDVSASYYRDMMTEIDDLTALFTFDDPGTLSSLLTTNVSVTQSDDLAALYDVEPWSGSGDYPTFPDGTRAGLLQRAALLVSNLEQTNPFHRGAVVMRNFLCVDLPTPDPNDLPPGALDLPPTSDAQTTRERFQAKVEDNALCSACHGVFSDVGYVMESYDALGRYRTAERLIDEQSGDDLGELPLNTVGTVTIGNDVVEVADAAELNQRIADSGQVESCVADHFFRFVARRVTAGATNDTCVVQDLSARLADQEATLADAFKSVARYSSFFQRKVGPQ